MLSYRGLSSGSTEAVCYNLARTQL
jgi:hypothetical protein